MRALRAAGKNLASLAFWLLVWELLSLRVDSALLLPEPGAVAARTLGLMLTAQFWRITAVSLLRILCGVAAAVLLGTLTAARTARVKTLHVVVSPQRTAV